MIANKLNNPKTSAILQLRIIIEKDIVINRNG